MREIKFRALVTADGIDRMVYFDLPEMDNGLWAWPMDKTIFHIDEYLSPIMQFTGLKDKNGKDIYECDIVQVPHQYIKPIAVYWNNEMTGFYPLLSQRSEHLEVIGNIHENPELINQKQ